MVAKRAGNNGFTLLELLVAIAVFAIMSLMAYSGLNTVLNSYSHIKQKTEQLTELQTAFTLISRDIEQAIERPVRNSYGEPLEPMTNDSENLDIILEFTRTGRPNPAALPRSNLQRIAYMLDDGQLIRLNWPVLDRAPETEPYETALLTKIKSVSIRFLDENMEWQEEWPLKSKAEAESGIIKTPKALEITIDSEIWGEIRRLFRVPGACATAIISNNTETPSSGPDCVQ